MPMLVPTSLDEATTMLAEHPGALILGGGTDLMVEINDGHRRPDGVGDRRSGASPTCARGATTRRHGR